MGESGALAGKTNMSNQTAAAIAAITNAVNWERKGLDLQAIINAGNQGRLGTSLTDWLVAQCWNGGRFVVKDHFVIDTGRKARVKISELGANFKNWFQNTLEDRPPSTKLVPITLTEALYDRDILIKLGGVAKSISSLGELFSMMQAQSEGPKSEAGQLLTNGYANIVYVPQPVKKIDDTHFSYASLSGDEVIEELKDP